MKSHTWGAALAVALLACAHARAQTTAAPADAEKTAAPDGAQSITVRGHYNNAVGTSDAASQGVIESALLKSRPALRPGEVLEFVPGVIVTQHSGDGKANQYFLRGFNLDHGTDFATSVGGMPVNMPTHGHGQGYTDLNFLLPELVQRIEYRKGPYYAKSGDFASAGAADISYRTRLDGPVGQVTLGENGYLRGVAGSSFDIAPGLTLLSVIEAMQNDGPWTVPERLRKRNGLVSLSSGTAAQGWSVSAMGYSARWTATDQIPQRLIDAGTYDGRPFSRFDSLDSTSGGDTARSSLSGEWHTSRDDGSRSRVSAYALRYRLDLNSNFTYALDRPDDGGDQFKQRDQRTVFGAQASHARPHRLFDLEVNSEVGVQLRQDRIKVGLFNSVARQIRDTTREDRVHETMLSGYVQSALPFTPALRAVLGLRADQVRSQVSSISSAGPAGRANAAQLSPKLSVVAGPWAKTEFFFNTGRGFHSNDARGSTAAIDPAPPLVASKGLEFGARTEVVKGLQSSVALWRLHSDSELVYVGDAGVTVASGASRRRGVEWNNRWVPAPWLLLDADLAWTHARFAAGDRIPNAVDRVASVAATLRELGLWSASLQWRYLGSGALIEDNSVRSKSSLTTNLRVSRKLGQAAELTLDVFNLGARKVDDIQYFYESQLPTEKATGPVADRHVHPAEPRTLRLSLRVGF